MRQSQESNERTGSGPKRPDAGPERGGAPGDASSPTATDGGRDASDVRPHIIQKAPLTRGQKVRRRLALRKNRALVSVVMFVIAWHLIAKYIVDRPLFLATPWEVWISLKDLWQQGKLQKDLWVSAVEFGKGFSGGLVTGVLLGMALGTSRRVKDYLDPMINGMYATPIIALAPLFILWFGIGQRKTVVLVYILVVLPIAINTDVGIRATDPQLLEAAQSFGANKLKLFTTVRLPTSISFMVAGIRMGIARGLIGVVVGEFFGSQVGLGRRILIASQFFDNGALMGGVLIFALTGVILVKVFEVVERRIAPWKFLDD